MAKLKEYGSDQISALSSTKLSTASGTISGFTSKATPVGADVVLVEDSESSYARKRVQLANLNAASPIVVLDKTADYTIKTGEADGLHTFTNNGATGEVKFTLPGTPNNGIDSYNKLLLHMDDAGLTDYYGKAITLNGNAARSAAQSKFGGYSASFDGSGDYLSTAYSSDFDFGTGDFTVDFWVRVSSFAQSELYFCGSNGWSSYQGAGAWLIGASSTSISFIQNLGVGSWSNFSATYSLPLNQWKHVAISRSSGTAYIFVDGSLINSGSYSTNLTTNGNTFYIGGHPGTGYSLNGYIDELRIGKGVARWTASFTPSSSAYAPASSPIGAKVKVLNVAGQKITVDAGSATIKTESTVSAKCINSTKDDALTLACTDASTWTSTIDKGDWAYGPKYGFVSNGFTSTYTNAVERFSMTSSANAVSWGTLTNHNSVLASGCSSLTQGFSAGGHNGSGLSIISKFDFSANSTGSSHGDLGTTMYWSANPGSSSESQGFVAGGSVSTTTIKKFNFSSNTTAVNHGTLSTAISESSGHTSSTDGFTGGMYISAVNSLIQKYGLAANTTSSSWGNLSSAREAVSGVSSSTRGYCCGGTGTQFIDIFLFASTSTSTQWGNLSAQRGYTSSHSGFDYGFVSGGYTDSAVNVAVVERFSLISTGNVSSWGVLTVAKRGAFGHQG